jgi:hypothetical protein
MMSNRELDAQIVAFERKFKLFDDLEATSTKEWLVRNFLGAGEASAVYGKPGDGKSVLAEDLGLHIAAGWRWHGRAVKQGAVVYVALERRKLVERRAIAFRKKHGPTGLPFAIVGGIHDFRDQRTAARIADIVAEVEQTISQPIVLIIIDTLSRALCGGDENSSKDMGAIVNATSVLLNRTKAHVMWIHHIPIEGGDRLRGHGALLGALDTTISVIKSDTVRTATVVKANDSEEDEAVAFTLESVTIGEDQDGNPTTAPVVIPFDGAVPDRPTKNAKLPKAAQTALRALAEAISERGEPALASNHIPAGATIVPIPVWRQQAYQRGISTSDEDRAKQQAFKRASEYLIGAGRVGVWDGSAWLTSGEQRTF